MAEILNILSKHRHQATELTEKNKGNTINGSSATLPNSANKDAGSKDAGSKAAAIFLLDKDEIIILLEGSGLDELKLNKYELVGGHIHEEFSNIPLIINVISKAVKNRKRTAVYELPDKFYEISITYTYKNKKELNGIIIVVFESSPPHYKSKDASRNTHFQQLFENSPDAIVILDCEDNIVTANRSFENIFGYKNNLIIGENIYGLIQPVHLRSEIKEIKDSILASGVVKIETERIKSNGEYFDVSMIGYKSCHGGENTGSFHIYSDITNIKENKESIKNAIMEKEMLLKEIHHRVKNNLQIISSLLLLQSKALKNKDIINVILESQNRIKSISLIHEKLYQSKNLSRIDFDIYLHTFIPHLFQTFGKTNGDINYTVKAGNVFLNTDTAIPCGLIINEIVSNSLKYAFPNEQKGEITIELIYHNDNNVTLVVSDNGIGIPEGINLKNPPTLGLQIITLLVKQLNGTIELCKSKGTAFNIRFPFTEYKYRN